MAAGWNLNEAGGRKARAAGEIILDSSGGMIYDISCPGAWGRKCLPDTRRPPANPGCGFSAGFCCFPAGKSNGVKAGWFEEIRFACSLMAALISAHAGLQDMAPEFEREGKV